MNLCVLHPSVHPGCILLDVEGDNFPSIADKIVEQLQETGQLPHDKVVFISQALYKRHRSVEGGRGGGYFNSSYVCRLIHIYTRKHTEHRQMYI